MLGIKITIRISELIDAINKIKAHPNNFRNKLISFLNNGDNDGAAFKSRIAELYLELERKHIFNKCERIIFEKIVIEKNPNEQNDFMRNKCTYKTLRNIAGRPAKEVDILLISRNGSIRFRYTQINSFDIDDLIFHQDFIRLTEPQQKNLKACYEEINPSKPTNLLTNELNNCI